LALGGFAGEYGGKIPTVVGYISRSVMREAAMGGVEDVRDVLDDMERGFATCLAGCSRVDFGDIEAWT